MRPQCDKGCRCGGGLSPASGMGAVACERDSSSAGGDILQLAQYAELQRDGVNKGSDRGKQCFPVKRNSHQQERLFPLRNHFS